MTQSSVGFTSASTGLSRRNMGYYAQLQGVYADRLFITPGIRVEENEYFGQFVNPKLSGAYIHKETGTKIRGSVGRGIRAPSFTELIGFPNFGIPGNFNLKPEEATSWEVGGGSRHSRKKSHGFGDLVSQRLHQSHRAQYRCESEYPGGGNGRTGVSAPVASYSCALVRCDAHLPQDGGHGYRTWPKFRWVVCGRGATASSA